MKGEKRETKMDGTKPIKNSGRGILKGDAALDGALIDLKHYSSSFSITKKNWEKHWRDAWQDGYEMGMFEVVLGDEDGSQVKVAVIDWEWFRELWDKYTEDNDD